MGNITWADGVSGDWLDGPNWIGGAAPQAIDDAVVSGTGQQNIAITGSAAANSLELADAGAAIIDTGTLTLTGNADLSNGAFQVSSGGSLIASGITIEADGLLYTTSGSGIVQGDIVDDGEIEVGFGTDPASSLVISGAVSGTGLAAIGAGTLELAGADSQEIDLDGAATPGLLKLDTPDAFTGTIYLTSAGAGSIDLAGIDPASVSYTGMALAFTDNGQSETLAVMLPAGSRYAAIATSDNNGGSDVAFIEPSPLATTELAGVVVWTV